MVKENKVTLVGYVHSHNLKKNVTGPRSAHPNTTYISGSVNIMTDESGLNVVPVNYVYVTPVTKKGASNKTFEILDMILNNAENVCYTNVGPAAMRVRVESSINVNDFIGRNGDWVADVRVQGGFISAIPMNEPMEFANKYQALFVMTNVAEHEADEETQAQHDVTMSGWIFDSFTNALIPFKTKFFKEDCIKAVVDNFEPTNANPVVFRVYGSIQNITVSRTKVEKAAVGSDQVSTVNYTHREWVADSLVEVEPFGESVTEEEMITAMQNRETHLAEVKRRDEEYKASKAANMMGNGVVTASSTPASPREVFGASTAKTSAAFNMPTQSTSAFPSGF